ncbi:nitrate reductase [Pseudogulbenkiania subflava]|uniref:Assimilatory nitrate reductase (NADH) alpha subunit apoprotein n=1 Tax=Pseudogulbenkiania subflava DSM 22618 TaxID=1123014 RepID=A0A1Y6BK35_9NEIS|nr:nitrate reductase [Pseudogulbenkiania subflava]SMF15750.1 assimilatory nitrate reductase (NADH) alpha subunit apoprotein [Pseudogulbenkiania subflava DSM 22618]
MTETTGRNKTVSSICCYCGTGCGVLIQSDGQRLTSVEGDPTHPANLGRLCSKGRTLADTTGKPGARLLYPEQRLAKDAPRQRVAWDDAIETAADRIAAAVAQHGPNSVAFYLSGQLLTEDYYVFNKLTRAVVGTNNVDTNSRLCMSSAVAGYKATLGADAPPACYEDIDQADVVLIAGSNMAYAHPVLFRRLEAAKAANPAMKVIVIDPRRTDTASLADLFLPILPGTDVALFHAMLNVLVWDDLLDRDYIEQHTEGFAKLKDRLREFTPRAAADICGISEEDIVTAARWFGRAGAALSFYTMGLNQSAAGTDKNAALIHLHLATGQIGKPGAGPFSLTGQPNAMGGREVGGLSNLLSAHRDLANPEHRAEVAAIWGVDSIPAEPGLPAIELFEAAAKGQIKVLWVVCTNPAQSLPDQALVRRALEKVDFVIVQEAFAGSETLPYADLVLPASTWPEKDGTVTNSERRISRVRAALPAPGEARHDWIIARDVAQALEARLRPLRPTLFPYDDGSQVFAEHVVTTAGRDLDITGLSYAVLDEIGPQQWPFPAGATSGKARLYQDGRFATPSGRARFVDIGYRPVAENVSAQYPLRLTTGRLRDHWHTMSRTALVPGLTRHVEEPVLSLNQRDLDRFHLKNGDLARIKSRRGAIVLPVEADDNLRPGMAFLPMHWGGAYMAGNGVNALTLGKVDPVSRQPELKHAAITLEPARLPWRLTLLVKGDVAELRQRLTPWLARFPYAVLLSVVAGGAAVRLKLAAESAPEASLLEALADSVTPADAMLAAFDDPARSVLRRVWLNGKTPCAYLLAGDVRAEEALSDWFDDGETPDSLARLLMGGGTLVHRSRVVCACTGVREDAIVQAIAAGCDVEGLKSGLGCGSGCGSCVPELTRMVAAAQAAQGA